MLEDDLDAQNPDSNLKCTIKQLQMYLNSSHTLIADLLQGEKRLMLLYPVDINLESQFYHAKNLNIAHVLVSMIELEFSFKQIFFFALLTDRIMEAVRPLLLVLENIQSKRSKVVEDTIKKSTMLTLQTSSIFFALIKETSEESQDVLTGLSSIPLLSLEIKHL